VFAGVFPTAGDRAKFPMLLLLCARETLIVSGDIGSRVPLSSRGLFFATYPDSRGNICSAAEKGYGCFTTLNPGLARIRPASVGKCAGHGWQHVQRSKWGAFDDLDPDNQRASTYAGRVFGVSGRGLPPSACTFWQRARLRAMQLAMPSGRVSVQNSALECPQVN